jgi:hypothetical protein
LSPVTGGTAPPIRHADSVEPCCASSPSHTRSPRLTRELPVSHAISPSHARSPVSPCHADARPGSPMPPPHQPFGPLRLREDQPRGWVRFQSPTWVRITVAVTSNFWYRDRKTVDFRSIPGIGGIGGGVRRYHLMVQPFFFVCASNHSIKPGWGQGLSRLRLAALRGGICDQPAVIVAHDLAASQR